MRELAHRRARYWFSTDVDERWPAASAGERAAQHGRNGDEAKQRGREGGGLLTAAVEVAEARGRGEAASVGEETSLATGRKSATVTALRGVPGSGEETQRELVLGRFHSRTEEAPEVLVAAAR